MESSTTARRWLSLAAILALFSGASAMAPVDAAAADPPVVRKITVPVQGKFSYSDDFGDPRSGGRTHRGNDLMVPKMRPLLAATDAEVRRVKIADGGNEGNMLVLEDEDGWQYWYIHINNDTPGTDDGLNPLDSAFAPGIERGARVTAGQVVAYAGDSGNAENTGAHLHFEIHQPDGTAINPYFSLRLAQGFRVADLCAFDSNPRRRPDSRAGTGYWLLAPDGGVFSFGDAGFFGSTGGMVLNRPIVGMAATPSGLGYWLVASDGGVFSFGDAGFFGSTGGMVLNRPIVGMAATPSGLGYWLVASDGGVFSFGDAGFLGSTGGITLNKPIVGLSPSGTGLGYRLVASDGGVFSYGDAGWFGSTGGTPLNQPVIALAPTPQVSARTPVVTRPQPSTTTTTRRRSRDPVPTTTTTTQQYITTTSGGAGYWLMAADGGIFAFGDATYAGSLPGTGLCRPPGAARLAPTATGKGYWIAGSDGSVTPFGDAPDLGSPKALGLTIDPVGLVVRPVIPTATGRS